MTIVAAPNASVGLPAGAEKDEDFNRAVAAAVFNESRIVSGEARGTWSLSRPNGAIYVKASWELRFSGDAYNLNIRDIENHGEAMNDDRRRHIVCDGRAIAYTVFAPRYHPSGCESELLANDLNEYVMATNGLESPVHRFAAPILNARTNLAEFAIIDRRRLETGNLEYRLRVEAGKMSGLVRVLEIAPDAGFNFVRSAVYLPDGLRVLEVGIEWTSIDGLWWPRRYEVQRWTKAEPEWAQTLLVECNVFEPNGSIDPHLFTLDSLDRCGETRLIDRRDGNNVKLYMLPSAGPVPGERSESITDAVPKLRERETLQLREQEALPVPPAVAENRRSPFFYMLVLANGLALVAVIALVALQRRRSRS